MSRILFINGNLHGHINPTLPIVKELVRLGEEVYYFSTKEFQEKLEAAGAVFMDYGSKFDLFLKNFRPHGAHPFYTLMEYMLALDRAVVPIVLNQIQGMHFDCIAHDVMFGGGNILSEKLHIPSIASCSSFVMEKPPLPPSMLEPGFHPQLDYLLNEINAAKDEWQLKNLQISDIFYKAAPEVLVYTSQFFHPSGDSFGSRYHFVGPSINDRNETIDFPLNTVKTKKLVYISLGTIMNHCIDFYSNCIKAFEGTEFQAVISVGSKTDLSAYHDVPENIMIRNYIPQLEVLKQADVMISHGGLNSVSEALYYGVPVIAIPLSNDQPAVAKRLTELGAGMMLKLEECTPLLLLNSAKTVCDEPIYRRRSDEIRETFHRSGGYEKAAEIIMNYIPLK